MKAIQSQWFMPLQNGVNYSCGWLSPKYNLFSWALSSLQLTHLFNDVKLITDNIGYDIAVEKLQLPYSHVNTDLETVKQNSYLWVSNKLYAYSIQDEPFIHLDTDAYLFNKIDSRLLHASLIAQNFEYDHENYVQAYQDVLCYCEYIPKFIKKDVVGRLTAVNAGIIGGNDVSFFKEFTAFVTDFLHRNETGLIKCYYTHLNVFVEQFLYKKYAEFKNVPIEYISPIEFGPPCDYKMSEFTQLPTDCNYIHITNYKRNPIVCEQMAQRLWLESPELYERVVTVCRQLEATHYPITLLDPAQLTPFYRTQYVLTSLRLLESTLPLSKQQLTAFIAALPANETSHIVTDVFEYESGRHVFAESLPDLALCWKQWQQHSHQTNKLLSLPSEQYTQRLIRQSSRCVRLDSEWNWAEANEFAGQTAEQDLANNLTTEPAYHEVLLYYYPHQQLVREQLLDALNMLILDAVCDPSTILGITDAVIKQILEYQPQADQQELSNTIISRIRHFLYHGVLEVAS